MITTPVPDAIPIDVHYATPDGVQWIELSIGANNYDGFAESHKALDAGGRRYVRTGWNSDTGRVLYRCPGRPIAFPTD